MRWRLTRASHSEISSETSARPMAMRQRRAAALPARGLNQGVHRRREGARFTGNIGDERDGRAKLPNERAKASTVPTIIPGRVNGNVMVKNTASGWPRGFSPLAPV